MAHWRDTYKPARFWIVDARAALPIALALFWLDWWTIGIAVTTVVVLWACDKRGLTVPGALRAVRSWIAGPLRPPLPAEKARLPVDHDRVSVPWLVTEYPRNTMPSDAPEQAPKTSAVRKTALENTR